MGLPPHCVVAYVVDGRISATLDRQDSVNFSQCVWAMEPVGDALDDSRIVPAAMRQHGKMCGHPFLIRRRSSDSDSDIKRRVMSVIGHSHFELKAVVASGAACSACWWGSGCAGCPIAACPNAGCIAVDLLSGARCLRAPPRRPWTIWIAP